MQIGARVVLLAAFSLVTFNVVLAANLSEQRARAQEQQQNLRARIKILETEVKTSQTLRNRADQALQESEQAISDIQRRLADLANDVKAAEVRHQDIKKASNDQALQLEDRRKELAELLRSHYTSGLSPWTALLSGEDPHTIGRDLAYLEYISKAQKQAMARVEQALKNLNALHQQAQLAQDELLSLRKEMQTKEQQLQKQRQEREQVLNTIAAQLKEQRSQVQTLSDDEARLSGLIQKLDIELAKEKQEAARREQERREKQARQEQQQRQEQEKQREKTRQEREQLLTASGLPERLSRPVQGEIQGRFGAARPEGGVWRGIVLRSKEGTPVKAVADGRVVYASWLGGFGNIIIVDHGKQFLSVYAYNQSLRKQVGDIIHSQDVIATVGATGGQVEPGLYFEIRHQGKPVNPLLWLKP